VGAGRVDGGGIGDGSGGAGVAVDAVGAGAEDYQLFAGTVGELECAGQRELLIAAAGAGRAVERDGHFAAGDEATAWMLGAQGVKALRR
jgi:hypothetical protein